MLFICSVLSIVCTDCESCAVFINCAEFRGSKASEVLNVCTVYVLYFLCYVKYVQFFLQYTHIIQFQHVCCSVWCTRCVRASLDPSWFFVGRRTFTSGIWHQWMGCGGIQTDMHTQTDRWIRTSPTRLNFRRNGQRRMYQYNYVCEKQLICFNHSKERLLINRCSMSAVAI